MLSFPRHSYTLIPVTEALADHKSFAFRPGRSQQDAFAYILDAIKATHSLSEIMKDSLDKLSKEYEQRKFKKASR